MGIRMFKKFKFCFVAAACVACAHAEMRTWTLASGKTLEGEYVSMLFDNLVVKAVDGKEVKIAMDLLSKEDVAYLELRNPPALSVDFLEDVPISQIDGKAWASNDGALHETDPVFIINARFGARVKNKTTKDYNHKLTVEVIVLTKQMYDPDKYHILIRSRSEPFVLSDTNKQEFEYFDEKTYEIIYYKLGGTDLRGEKPAERLILVRDERDEIIAYDTSKKWIYNNMDKLFALPTGAWIDKKCNRVYPTNPVSRYN